MIAFGFLVLAVVVFVLSVRARIVRATTNRTAAQVYATPVFVAVGGLLGLLASAASGGWPL